MLFSVQGVKTCKGCTDTVRCDWPFKQIDSSRFKHRMEETAQSNAAKVHSSINEFRRKLADR
jgi:predicted transcriptional regulator